MIAAGMGHPDPGISVFVPRPDFGGEPGKFDDLHNKVRAPCFRSAQSDGEHAARSFPSSSTCEAAAWSSAARQSGLGTIMGADPSTRNRSSRKAPPPPAASVLEAALAEVGPRQHPREALHIGDPGAKPMKRRPQSGADPTNHARGHQTHRGLLAIERAISLQAGTKQGRSPPGWPQA